MNASDSLEVLRRANPRGKAGFAESVEAVADRLSARIASTAPHERVARRPRPGRRPLVGISAAGVALATAAAVSAVVVSMSPGDGSGIDNAVAAISRAATVTAASAERSGTAVVWIAHNGQAWDGTTVRWHGADVAVTRDAPQQRRKTGDLLRVVDGTLYGIDPAKGGWVDLGKPENIDPDSGTTPAEYIAAAREDVGGQTLRRITGGMTGLTTTTLDDGSTVYRGMVAAGLIARETGHKEGQAIRVLPFGFVAHDEAADGSAPLDTAVTVGADGVVRKLTVTWGTSASAWTYTVSYRGLGATAAPVAPPNARPLRKR
jgi:hypothetical protein